MQKSPQPNALKNKILLYGCSHNIHHQIVKALLNMPISWNLSSFSSHFLSTLYTLDTKYYTADIEFCSPITSLNSSDQNGASLTSNTYLENLLLSKSQWKSIFLLHPPSLQFLSISDLYDLKLKEEWKKKDLEWIQQWIEEEEVEVKMLIMGDPGSISRELENWIVHDLGFEAVYLPSPSSPCIEIDLDHNTTQYGRLLEALESNRWDGMKVKNDAFKVNPSLQLYIDQREALNSRRIDPNELNPSQKEIIEEQSLDQKKTEFSKEKKKNEAENNENWENEEKDEIFKMYEKVCQIEKSSRKSEKYRKEVDHLVLGMANLLDRQK